MKAKHYHLGFKYWYPLTDDDKLHILVEGHILSKGAPLCEVKLSGPHVVLNKTSPGRKLCTQCKLLRGGYSPTRQERQRLEKKKLERWLAG